MVYRVPIAQFMHETNTFSKLKTTLEDYRKENTSHPMKQVTRDSSAQEGQA